MKTSLKLIISAVSMLIIFTQCDSITPNVDESDLASTIQLLSPSNGAADLSPSVELEWNRIKGAKTYRLLISNTESFDATVIDTTVGGNTFKSQSLSHNSTYHWKVFPIKNRNSGPWSDAWSFTTFDQGNEGTGVEVSLLSPDEGSTDVSTDVEFEWEEVDGITQYQFQLSESSSFSELVEENVVSGTSYSSEALTYDKAYFWRVKADVEESKWSLVYRFETETEPISQPPPSSGSFVEVQNSNFVIDGQVTKLAGTNAYYLPNYEKLNSAVVDRAFDLFQDTGVNVVRMWGFYDGYDCGYSKNDSNENVIQTAPGEYDERALRDLDRVIAKGKDHGVKFIIPFVNYWDELGGICQYNTWAGSSNPSRNMEFFINNDQTQKWFRDYIDMLLNRVNTVTGVKYKDEPAIFAWQVINEGRNKGGNPQLIRDWYQEIAQYIKSIDPNHLVGTGEEGFDEGTPSEYSTGEYSNTYVLRAQEGTSYVMNTAIPEIDFGSAHWYPNEWGFGTTISDDLLRAQSAWIGDHQAIAKSHGKPFMLAEFGFPGWADDRVSEMYNDLYSVVESKKVDVNLLWQLVADGTKCWEFGGNICYPGGRTDTELYNKFKQHVTNMNALN